MVYEGGVYHMGRLLKRFFVRMTVIVLVLTLIGIGYSIHVVADAPEVSVIDATPKYYRSYVLDDTGNVVLTLCGQESNRVYVQLSEMPDLLQKAFVAIEDERFYIHMGIDPKGIVRAVVKGIKAGGLTQGASTITQQLIKNNVLTGWTEEKNTKDKIDRKLQEMYLAIRLERKVSKDWILENYLNTINLGGGNWGVETAARYYFDKDISQLNLSECAVLAGITKNPTRYNPAKNPEKNEERRGYVLSKMVELGYISEEEKAEALADPVYERIAQVRERGTSPEIMSYFEDALIYKLVDDLEEKGYSEEEAWNLLYRGGLTIYSTESSAIQEYCEQAANDDGLYDSDAQISMVVIENENGFVKALIGGRGTKDASLLFNRATSAVRQPGSVIKILGEYAAGLDSGIITLGTALDDAPYTYSDGTDIVNANGKYGGMTTIRDAIADSNNIVALKSFQRLGMEQVWSQLSRFGLSSLTDADKVEALALGGTSGGVTNLELTAAYCAIARGGDWIEPVYYTKVVDRNGNVVLENVQEHHEAVGPAAAALLTSAMQDVVKKGTGSTAYYKGMNLAGKSGTTSGIRDAWFLGFSPYYTCGVWGGFDDNSTQPSSKYVQGVWKEVMRRTNEPRENREFGTDAALVTRTICKKCGLLAVDGLCDKAISGNTVSEELFVSGTEPKEKCSCHVAVELCTVSGEKAGNYCPSRKAAVYLKSATPGTQDEAYVIPESFANQDTCHTHTNIWQFWFGRFGADQGADPSEDGYGNPDAPDSQVDNNGNAGQNGSTGRGGSAAQDGSAGRDGSASHEGRTGQNGSGQNDSSGSDDDGGSNSGGSRQYGYGNWQDFLEGFGGMVEDIRDWLNP